jgi:hypothetical protein
MSQHQTYTLDNDAATDAGAMLQLAVGTKCNVGLSYNSILTGLVFVLLIFYQYEIPTGFY